MAGQAPSIDSAWAWLVGLVPAEWRPALGVFAAVIVLLWLAINGLKTILELAKTWQDFQRRRAVEREPKPQVGPLPPARVSIWTPVARSPSRPKTRESGGIPIITTANMKGGVGKTTLTANLAAYLDKHDKKILLVDLDYQGSLSQTTLAAANVSKMGSVVDDLIRGDKSMGAILEASQTLTPALPNSRILTCYYEFSDTETHEMVDWLIALREGKSPDDVRFRLSRLLQDEAVQKHFDAVIIDAPPRFSTGTINALCASTHLIVPTVLDQMSAEAVIYFSRDVAAMKNNLFPNLQLVGVVPTLTHNNVDFTPREKDIITNINTALRPYWGVNNAVLERAFVPRKNWIGDVSGTGVGYYNAGQTQHTRAVRAIFDRVGKEIEDRVWA